MNSLADQLMRRGLASKEAYDQNQKQKCIRTQTDQGSLKNKFKDIKVKGIVAHDETQLENADTVNEFKRVAKGMLEDDLGAITLIIKKAHEFRDKAENKRIVWFFYSVRDGLKKCPKGREQELLKRMFRRNNPKFELSEKGKTQHEGDIERWEP